MFSAKFAHWFAMTGERQEVPAENENPETEPEAGLEVEPEILPEVPAEPLCPEPEVPEIDVPDPVVPEPVIVPEPEVPLEPDQTIEVIRDENITNPVTEELPRIDNREELEKFEFPSLDLLKDYGGRHASGAGAGRTGLLPAQPCGDHRPHRRPVADHAGGGGRHRGGPRPDDPGGHRRCDEPHDQ